jgi:hypothetical protein
MKIKIMRAVTRLPLALLPLCVSCGPSDAQVKEDEARFQETVKAQEDALQWKLDDEVASQIFTTESDYLTFRRCHEHPPTLATNQKRCATLQDRVAKAEARLHRQVEQEKHW